MQPRKGKVVAGKRVGGAGNKLMERLAEEAAQLQTVAEWEEAGRVETVTTGQGRRATELTCPPLSSQGSSKLEKAEVLQMTVDHLKMLHATGGTGTRALPDCATGRPWRSQDSWSPKRETLPPLVLTLCSTQHLPVPGWGQLSSAPQHPNRTGPAPPQVGVRVWESAPTSQSFLGCLTVPT